MSPKISIIVPSYNHASFLQERFESIFNQTYTNFELIILDDASQDGSQLYLSEIKDSRISHILFNDFNSGSPCSQWLKGINYSSGDYIWIAESDDFCDKYFLENLLTIAIKGYDLVYCRSLSVNSKSEVIDSLFWPDGLDFSKWKSDYTNSGMDEIMESMVYRNTIPNASSCIFKQKNFIFPDFLSELKYSGDWYFWVYILQNCKLAYVAKPLNYFRLHEKTTRNFNDVANEVNRFLEIFMIHKKIIKLINIDYKRIKINNYHGIFDRIKIRIKNVTSILFLYNHVPSHLKYMYFNTVLFPLFRIRFKSILKKIF